MRTFVAFLLAFAVAGCGGEHDHDDHDHDHEAEHEGHDDEHHHHVAPGGGLLVELGAHEGNVQFLFDEEKGELTARLWGPHAEQPAAGAWGLTVLLAAGVVAAAVALAGPVARRAMLARRSSSR